VDTNETGLEPVEPTTSIHCSYDAGEAGCSDGLHMDFRRQIQAIEVGQLIEFVVRDPSAKEDLPPLARMMGHRIRTIEERADGTLSVVVERAR
jgi:TusA-related sulfurtransferase